MQGQLLDLVLMDLGLLSALMHGTLREAQELVTYRLTRELSAEDKTLFELRINQTTARPEEHEWLLRAIVHRESNTMVGFANFHGPPGINDTGAENAVSIGYTVFPEFKGRGFATETVGILLDWAKTQKGVRHFVCGVAPQNAASLRVLEKHGFRRTGLIVDGEHILELHQPLS